MDSTPQNHTLQNEKFYVICILLLIFFLEIKSLSSLRLGDLGTLGAEKRIWQGQVICSHFHMSLWKEQGRLRAPHLLGKQEGGKDGEEEVT